MNNYSTQGYKRNSPDRYNAFNVIPSGVITMENVPHPVYGVDNLGNEKLMMPGQDYNFPGHTVYELPLKENNMKKPGRKLMQKGGSAKFEYIHEDRNGNKFTVHRGNEPISQQQFDHLVDVSRAYPYNPQATGSFMPSHPIHDIRPGEPMEVNGGMPIVAIAPQQQVAQKKNGGYSGTYSNGVYFENGGPTFPVAGAGPLFMMGGAAQVHPFAMNPGPGYGTGMLQEYGNETMQMGGNSQVRPFAMYAGSGTGDGMLEEYADERMKKGGHAKKHKKLSPQQMQMMMQAMAGAGQGQGAPMGMPPMGMPPQGMMPPQQGMAPQEQGMMASGGIHIKKSHEGKFTAYKERTGKTTEEALHSKDPHVRQMANFARNAAKWHHEFGGATQGGGNAIYDAQGNVFAYGGNVNPYHPLAKFMQAGGNVSPDDPMGGGMQLPGPNPSGDDAYKPTPGNYDPSTDPNNPVNNPPPMPEQGGYAAAQGPAYDQTGATDDQDDQQQQQQGQQGQKQSGWNKFSNTASVVLSGIGAAAGIAAAYSDKADQRRNAAYQRSLGMSDHIPVVNQPGSKGDYTQYGNFRPDAATPARPGNFYPRHQFGGAFAFGGNYAMGGFSHGQELELSDEQIAHMKKMGYQFEEL